MKNEPTHENGKLKEFKKQESWFKTEVDFENSFKWWFALQWQNHYIQLFIVAFGLLIAELVRFDWVIETVRENFSDESVMGGIFTIMGLSIPFLICLTIGYKGFYQYFNDLKHGRSR